MAANPQVDEDYEFCAPRFFDFLNEETEEQISQAERWFEVSLSYAPSPFMPKIRVGRSGKKINVPCDFGEVDKTQKSETVETGNQEQVSSANGDEELLVVDMEITDGKGSFGFASDAKPCESKIASREEERNSSADVALQNDSISFAFPVLDLATVSVEISKSSCQTSKALSTCNVKTTPNSETFTPKAQKVHIKETTAPTCSKNQTAKKMASSLTKKKSSCLKTKNSTLAQSIQGIKPQGTASKCPAKNAISIDISQENQAIKRQKLDGGRSRQIHNVKAPVLLHKSKPDLSGGNDLFTLGAKGFHEQQRKEVAPYISTAEMIHKFQSRTREIELPHSRSFVQDSNASIDQMRPKLTLTRPKEPELQTSHRVRAVRVKSSAELEKEMLAKIPKFKARPLNKKILEAPSLPALPRSTPQQIQFQEFHLKTMERANQHAETASVVSSVDASSVNQGKPSKLTEPRPPILETSLRARPTKIKSSQELELEELERIPKFKARPLNKKIFESKGDLGLFCQSKTQITTPQEFHFATNDRLGPPSTMIDHFDKLSLHSESSHHSQQDHPRITKPNPFHLYTEERGLEKDKMFTLIILQKQLEEENARIPKANPYPYTTDYPVMPPKPQPKQCTKPDVFQLESIIRHEEEIQRKLEERERVEKEEAERRIFRAQPIMKEDPIPLPDRERKPLTEVQEFVLHVDHRATERSEFDKKIKEKELTGKRIREEQEHAKMIEEEREIKQLRRTMVPHVRPMPKFDSPFHPKRSTMEKTRPKSPKLLLVKQRDRKHTHLR